MKDFQLILNIYGHLFGIKGRNKELISRLRKDFFVYCLQEDELSEKPVIVIHCIQEQKERTFGNVFFDDGPIVMMDHLSKDATIYCEDFERLHELTYLYVLSIAGKRIDLQGRHRIHASAVSFNNDQAALFVGASGMGKSHLAYFLNGETLSDDTPFIDSKYVYPFLGRRGFANHHRLSKECHKDLYKLERLEYGAKYLLPIIEKSKKQFYHLNVIFLLKKSSKVSIVKASLWQKLIYFSRYLLVGEGTPLILKFFWEPGVGDFWVKTTIFFKRLGLALRLCYGIPTYMLYTNLSMDTVTVVQSFCEELDAQNSRQ